MRGTGTTAVVREAGGADMPALARLRAAWAGVAAEPVFERRVADWYAAERDRRTVWLAEIAGDAVGMVSTLEYRRMPWPGSPDARWGYIGSMFVTAEHRGAGVGAALLDAVIAAGEERGYARLVVRPSEEAIPFYARAGFVVADGHGGEALLVRRATSG